MLPDLVSNPGPLTYESGALPIALRGPAQNVVNNAEKINVLKVNGYTFKSRNCHFHIPANFLEFQRVKLLMKPQFTGFFRDILHVRTFWGKKFRVRLFLNI